MAKAKAEAEASETPVVPEVPAVDTQDVPPVPPVVDPEPEVQPVVDGDLFLTAEEVQAAADEEAELEDAVRAVKAAELAEATSTHAAAGLALAESGDVPSNAALLEWPTDRDGITADLKQALLNAAGRVNGREDKLEIILAVLSLGAKHILSRFASQVEMNAAAYAWLDQQNHERRSAVRAHGWQPN